MSKTELFETLNQLNHCIAKWFKVSAHWVRNFRTLKNKYDLTLCQSRLHTASETFVHQKQFGSGSIFCVFASVACILIGKDGEYENFGLSVQWPSLFQSTPIRSQISKSFDLDWNFGAGLRIISCSESWSEMMVHESLNEYRDTVLTALGWTELWIVSMYSSRSTLNKEKRFRARFLLM